ncbi:hypothetical protein Syun_008102 [Stephania yunnanensis]|uniref:3'-5' exonuclease domain-containing protein n=1 Tax=Stephania yunnanensis TaxID=152371 RepID=A0AAP0KZY9_9MAGN
MATWSEQIFSNDAHDVYDVHYDDDRITTTVTADPATVTNWISQVEWIHRRRLHNLVIGLDVEWRPNVHRNQQNPVALLQLCVGRVLQLCAGGRCLIFQLLRSPIIPYSLSEFLNHPTIAFVGVGIETYASRLDADYGLSVRNCVNLADLSAYCLEENELRFDGLKRLAWVVLRKVVAKPAEIMWSEWDSERLLHDQVAYASIHAFVSFQMGRYLFSNYF